MDRPTLEAAIRAILGSQPKARDLHTVILGESDRLAGQNAFTRDLFSLEESPRLGAGVMEVRQGDFPWHLEYDEIDYVIDGHLTVAGLTEQAQAGPGQIILIPRGSDVRFQAEFARFLYVTYPADWNPDGPG